MNEQIRLLMKQAGTDTSGKWMGIDHAEKFAELIVRECMELTKRCSTGSSIHDLFADEIIKQHFGVEE